MALLGLLLDYANGADARGIAEKASIGILVVEFTGVVALIASSFTATAIDEHNTDESYWAKANNTAMRILIGVDDAIERRRCR